jgi:hypothetical protein
MGRYPDGSDNIMSFTDPTPGGPNIPPTTSSTILLILGWNLIALPLII